jgi:hypothetical protein
MARMIADTISSRRFEQEGREEREVVEVLPFSGLSDLPVQRLRFFCRLELRALFGVWTFGV